jgi:hypothetical protein
MTEYEKLRESVVSATRTPEYQKFSEWSVDKQIDDPVRGRLDYADYLRKVHIDAGIATPEIEADIRKGLFSSLIKDGSLEEGDYSGFQKLTAVPDVSFETKLNLAQSHTDVDSEEWGRLAAYKEARDTLDEGDEQLLRLQERATEVLDRQYEIAKRNMLQSGELPFIATTDEQGNRVILAGEAANRMSFSKALEVSKAGGVSLSDAYLAKGQLDVVAGTKLQRFKYNRFNEALSVLSSLSEKDSNVSDQIKAHAQNLGEKEDEGFLDWSARKLDDVVDSVLGFFSEEREAQNERMENFQNTSTDKVIYELKDKLNSPDIVSAGEEFSYDDVKNAYDYLVLQTASSGNYFDLYEEKEAGRNIRMTSAGVPIVHTAALANENAFDDMVSARPDIDPEIFDQLRVQRTALLNQNFNHYDKILSRSGVDDEWREAVMEGRANGKQNHEILNDFLKNEDNYNTYWERTKGVASSVIEGVATLLAAIPAAMGNESAANMLAQVSQDSSDRREVARLFNQEYGYGMEVAEAIAPMTTDVLATTLLAGVTAPIGGAGGAAYLTARAGSVAGLKALTKGITSNVIKSAPSIIGRGGATKTLAEVIETSLKTVDGKLANDALKAYNKSLGRKLGVTTAVFVPAATRSGGSTYGSITNALRQTTDLSKEEIHDRAMGAAMLSGTITGVITSGFSFFGRGGLEDAFLRGMSFREFKTVLSSLDDFANTYTTGKVKDVLTSVIKKAPQSKGGFIRGAFRKTRGFTDEAMEEGLDQFINSYVEDAALEQDTPMIERLEQSFNAAVVGGIIGSAVTTAQQVAPRFQMNAAMRQQQESDFRRSLFEKASESLRESGSPITASVLETQYSIAARVRPEDTPLIGAETQPEVVNVSQRLEGKTPEELEQVADTVNQDLGQNYPEILQEKSLPEILSIAESVDPEKTPSPEQEAAIAIRDNVVTSLDRLDQVAEQEAAAVEEETSNKNAQDTEEIISDIQGTPDQVLRRKVNQVLSSNSPEKLDNFPKSKKGKEKQNAEKISGPIDIRPEEEIEVVETEVEVSPLKTQFIEEPDIAIFKSGKEFTEEEADAVEAVLELAEVGFPVRFNSNKTYGVPFTSKKLADKSEFLAKQIFSKYPLIQSEYYASKFTGMRAITRFDPATGKIAKGKVKGLLDNQGNGIFNNDPVALAEMLAHEIRIPVPDSVNVFDINPSIKVRDGFVVDVIKPSDTGIGVESAVTPVTPIKGLEFDLAAIENLTRIPFIEANKDDNVMPFGAREINERGFTQDVSDRKVTYGDIKRQLNDFYEASKTDGSLRRTLLQGSRGATLQQGYDLLDDTNADIAFNEAYLEYNRLLHLFELKGVMESQMNYAIEVVAGESRVKNNKKSKNAVKKALLSRVDIDSEAELAQAVQPFIAGKGKTHTDSIVGYVDTQILNNDAFKAGSMPTFDSVFKKKVKNYIAKEKVRGVQQSKNVEVDNANFDFDQIPDMASDIYGEGDQGVAYSGSLGSVDASDTIDDATFYNTLKDAISNMKSQIEASPALKASIVDLYIEAIQPNATPRMRGIVSEMETSELMGHLGTYLGTGSHTSRPEVLEFVRRLEEETLEAGVNIKDALYLSYLTYRYEGNPLDNSEAITEVQRLMGESLGRAFSRRDATNFIKSMDQAVRRRFSRAHVSEEVRAILEQQNAVDVERLGLVDGDPESVISAFKKIAKTSDSKSHKLVAELLLEDEAFLRTVEFSLGESLYPVAGQHSLLKDGRHVVYVNLRTGNGLGLENVLLEEYTHAFLSDVANKPEDSLNDNQRAARQRLQNLFTLAEKEYRKSKITTPVLEDAFENFDEFLANFLLSPKLQAHIKSLEPPKGQRGFFQRIMESLISMFRKLTGREKNAYTEALTDVISLSKTPFRTTAVPPAQAAMESAESASRDIKEVTEVLGTPEEQIREVATPEQIESQPDPDQEKIDNSIDNFINEVISSGNLASADQQRMVLIMLHLKNRLPLGVEVSVDLDMDAPASATANTVQINPKVLMRDLQNFDLLGSKVYAETLIHHELAHVASFNALTKKEISDYVMSLVEGDFIGIANTYYRDPAQRDAAIDLIQTEITEDTDPEILDAIAIEKQRLAEEKLRMHLEKVRTGTTTEDDYDFWSSDPSIFRIITRYIRAYFSRLSATKQMNRESTALDSLLIKVNREATLLNLGFNRNADIQSLDVNDPDASALEFARLVNYDPVEESSILQEQAEGVVRLYASTIPSDFPNVVMAKARLRMSDASEFVTEDRDKIQIAVDEGYVDEQDARELRDLSEDEVEVALQAELQEELTPTSRFKPVDIDVVSPDLNLGAVVSAVESLSNDTYKASVDIFEDDISGSFQVDIKLTNPSGELIGKIEDTEIRPSGVISIGYMANQTDAAKGFSSDLMTALIMVSEQAGINKVVTEAAGSNRGFVYKRKLVSTYNDITNSLSEEESEATRKQFLADAKLEQAFAMNGYYTWPSMGFKPDDPKKVQKIITRASNPEYAEDFAEDLVDEVLFNKSKFLRDLPEDKQQVIADKLREDASNISASIVRSAEFLESIAVKDANGDIDLNKTLNEGSATQNKMAAKAWKSIGQSIYVTFDLTEGSDSLKAYARKTIPPLLFRKIKEVRPLVSEFKQAKDQPDVDIESLRDEYNDRAAALGINFKLFASRGMPTTTITNLDFSNVVKLLEMPMVEFQTYKKPERWIDRILIGDVGSPVRDLIEQRDEFKRASYSALKAFQAKFKKVLEKDQIVLDDAMLQTIADAQGYFDGNLVSDEFYAQEEAAHKARRDAIKADDQLTKAQKKTNIATSRQLRDKNIADAEDAAISAIEASQNKAVQTLSRRSPDLATLITSMRKELIQPIQNKLTEAGVSKDIKIRIDKTGGFYLTRAYRIFDDPTYANKVREDKNYAKIRQAAMDYFEKSLKDTARAAALQKNSDTAKAEAAAEKALRDANKEAGNGKSYAQNVLEEFISRYEGVVSGDSTVSNRYSKVVKNLTKRKDLDKSLRDLLGEYGKESGTDLIVRTFSVVSNLAAEQIFRSNLAEVGKEQGFLVDANTARKNPELYTELKPSANRNDPLYNLFVKTEMFDDLKDVVTPPYGSSLNSTSEKTLSSVAAFLRNITGKSMLFKTLGSVGFYLRNIFGNTLFFGPAQGMNASWDIFKNSFGFSKEMWKDPNKLDAYLTELVGLGVFGDELRAGTIRELMSGDISPEAKMSKLNKLIEKIPAKARETGKAITKSVEEKLTNLSASIDGSYKIAYYEHELSILRQAKKDHPNTKIGSLEDYDLKRMAAKKVKMTAQSLSQAPPIVRDMTKGSYGLLLAPFLRFKAEVPRIVWNTYKLAKEEKASDNPTIAARGRKRFNAMTMMLGVFSTSSASLLSWLMGIGDDEEEALRKSMPEYLRGHTFFYFGDRKDLTSIDLTYLNPFSLLADPVMRSFESISKGDVLEGVGKFIQGLFLDQYLDEQILAGSLTDIKENRDSTTGRRIWIPEADSFGTALYKGMSYLFVGAYQPRVVKDVLEAFNAAGGDYHKFSDSPLGELLDGVYPVKTHSVDAEQQFRRFLRDHTSRLRDVTQQKFKLYGDKPISDDDVRDIYEQDLKGRMALNKELYRVTRGFDKLGVGINRQFDLMKQYGIGKDKARLIFFGVMDRPDINKRFLDGLTQRGKLKQAAVLFEERNKQPRYLMLKD